MSKFNRIYELRIQMDGIGDQPGEFIIVRSPMTVEFTVERNNLADQNSGNFKVYNLSKEHRDRVFHDYLSVYTIERPIGIILVGFNSDGSPQFIRNYPRIIQFYAGYEGEGPLQLVFVGNMLYSRTTRRGSDYITEIEALDPGTAKYAQQSVQTLAATTDKRQIIISLYEDLVGKDNAQAGIISESFKGASHRGTVLFGNTVKLLREITDDNFFFDLGIPMAIKTDETKPGTTIYEINNESGLLNIPIKDNALVTCTMVFSPEMQVNQAVSLKSLEGTYNDLYTIGGIRHAGIMGGTHDNQTTTQLTLINGKGVIW